MKVFEKGHLPITAQLKDGLYRLTIPFDTQAGQPKNDSD